MYDLLVYTGMLLVLALVVIAIQYKNRYYEVYHVLGVDMRGIENVTGYPRKVKWIRSRPDYKECHDPHDIIRLWERRDQVLDAITKK